MRWRGESAFSRPVRWLCALHGECVVPFAWGGVVAGGTTRLLRNAAVPELQVCAASGSTGYGVQSVWRAVALRFYCHSFSHFLAFMFQGDNLP